MSTAADAPALAMLLDPEPAGTVMLGIEREYRVLDRAGTPVDFRPLIGTLGLQGGHLDPSDPNAHHLSCGVLVTADGEEAEVATPPVATGPGATGAAVRWIEVAEDALLAALPAGFGIEGYSTHLNVTVTRDVVRTARRFAEHFAVGMMLLLDRRDSPGLLIRPRPGRLEIGGDFAEGEQLQAALTYALGAARACVDDSDDVLPPRPRGRIVSAKDRPGWYADRTAFADDLYRGGRRAVVHCGNEEVYAGELLARSWACARRTLTDLHESELRVVDAIVAGDRPIPVEAAAVREERPTTPPPVTPFARLHRRTRGTTVVEPVAVSWAAVAFRVHGAVTTRHVVVPRRWLASFLDRLDEGVLDDTLSGECTAAAGEPLALTTALDPRVVVPPEPALPMPWWRGRRLELIGLAAGAVTVLGAHQVLR